MRGDERSRYGCVNESVADAERDQRDANAEREKRRAEIAQMMSLWPFTSRVVCIAMLNADTARGQVLFTADDYEEEASEEKVVKFAALTCSRNSGKWRNVMKTWSLSMGAGLTFRSFTSVLRSSMCPLPARTGWAIATRRNRIATWQSN